MKRFLFTAILIGFSCLSFSQNSRSQDSLELLLKKSKGNDQISLLNQLSLVYLQTSVNKAFSTAFKAHKQASLSNNSELISNTYFNLGVLHNQISNYDSAKIYYKNALKISKNNENAILIIDNLGVLYKDLSKYDSSLFYHNQALKLKQTIDNKLAQAITYNNIANVYYQMKKYDLALENYNISLEIRKASNDKIGIAALLNNIGDTYKNLNAYDKAIASLNEALQIQKEFGNKQSIAYTLNGIGNFYFQLKIYDKAQEYYTKALELRLELGNKNDIAASRFNIATVHRDIGNYKEALKYYSMALDLRKETNNKEAQALTLTAIGGVYKNKKLYGLAIQNYKLALAMHKNIGSKLNIANSYERLGIVYKDTCLYNQSEEYYNKAMQCFYEIKNREGVARITNYMGNLYKEKSDFAKSLEYYKTSCSLYDTLKNISGKAYVFSNIADLYVKKKEIPTAISYFIKSLELARMCNEKLLIQSTTFNLYSLYKEKGQADKSLQFFEEYTSIKDSILHDKNIERIAELEFETNMKLLEQINENQDLKLRQEQARKMQFRLYLIISITLFFGILGFLFLLYKQYSAKKKAFNVIGEKKKELEGAYSELEKMNFALHEKNEKITDSLSYAKRIQRAILPSVESIKNVFRSYFVFYLPKEIVSGDFYWFSEQKQYAFFAVVDCTGHGVPGAFMSMVGNTLLNQIVNEFNIIEPADILNKLDKEIIKTLHQFDEQIQQEDGMEISLIRYDKIQNSIVFAGAGHKIFLIKDDEVECIASSIYSIGGMHSIKMDRQILFSQHEVPIAKDTLLYMFSDGYIDQFGGKNDERFSTLRFQNLLKEIYKLPINEQYTMLNKRFDEWRGSQIQIDDVLVVGIKF